MTYIDNIYMYNIYICYNSFCWMIYFDEYYVRMYFAIWFYFMIIIYFAAGLPLTALRQSFHAALLPGQYGWVNVIWWSKEISTSKMNSVILFLFSSLFPILLRLIFSIQFFILPCNLEAEWPIMIKKIVFNSIIFTFHCYIFMT